MAQVHPVTFASFNNVDEAVKTASTVQLNRKIEHQIRQASQLLSLSRSQRSQHSGSACISPPEFVINARQSNHLYSNEKVIISDYQNANNFKFQN